jgi:hypothetical protein
MKKSLIFLLPVMMLFAGLTTAYAQDADNQVSTNATEMRGDAANEEIRVDDELNVENPDIANLKSDDAGERAMMRHVEFDNWTPWYIRCYVDGIYQGTVAPYSELYIRLPRTETYRFYAEANFRDGSKKYWGGINRYVSGSFKWSLYE